jgi:hypothetical protein
VPIALTAPVLPPVAVRDLRAAQPPEWPGARAARGLLAEGAQGGHIAAPTRAASGAGRKAGHPRRLVIVPVPGQRDWDRAAGADRGPEPGRRRAPRDLPDRVPTDGL